MAALALVAAVAAAAAALLAAGPALLMGGGGAGGAAFVPGVRGPRPALRRRIGELPASPVALRVKAHHRAFLEWDKPPVKQKRPYKIRRKRRWIFDEKEHVWKNVDPPKVMPTPSEDADELFYQIMGRQKVEDVLEFLPSVVNAQVFNWSHVYASVTKLAKYHRHAKPQQLECIRQSEGLKAVGQKGLEFIEAVGPSEPLPDDPDRLVVVFRSIAVLAEEAPQLHPLASAIGEKLQSEITTVKKTNVVHMLWAIAQLRAHCPDLQDEMLPRILSHEKFPSIRDSIRMNHKLEGAYLWNALIKLKRDVPELREFLPQT